MIHGRLQKWIRKLLRGMLRRVLPSAKRAGKPEAITRSNCKWASSMRCVCVERERKRKRKRKRKRELEIEGKTEGGREEGRDRSEGEGERKGGRDRCGSGSAYVREQMRARAHTHTHTHAQAWLEGIDERIQKMRVQGDRDNESTAFVLRDLRKKVKATGVRTTF